MPKLTMDGKTVEAKEGQNLLDVAREAGIFVPALCYHPAIASYGACRLCLVEVKQGNRARIVTSCCYNVRDGLVVTTTGDKVVKARRGVMELLLARAPESEPLKEMARLLDVKAGRLPTVTPSESDCILCGLCVNVCREIIGASAISFVNRGVDRIVAAPFLQPSEACIGCGACAAVCPVGAIKLHWHADEVEISPFKSRVKILKCSECGAAVGSAPMADRVRKKVGEPPFDKLRAVSNVERLAAVALLCDSCKRKRAAATQARLARTSRS